jgi:hypothetical protein
MRNLLRTDHVVDKQETVASVSLHAFTEKEFT